MRTLFSRLAISAAVTAASASAASAALVASYQMEADNPLLNSAGATTYRHNLVNPGGANSPTHLASGGVGGSGAFQFDGADSPNGDYLNFGGAGYLFLGYDNGITPGPSDPQNHDYTFSFWIDTTDGASNTGGYAGTPQIPILGDVSGGVHFSLGIDNGRASYRYYDGGWQSVNGTVSVADGQGHYVTFVAHHDATPTIDIYVDGILDVANLAISSPGNSDAQLGRSYPDHAGEMILDDIRLYDEALDAATIAELFAIPEPTGLALLLVPLAMLSARRRRVR